MQRSLGGAAFEPAEQGRDREVTLGPGVLLGLAAGLLVLCVVCFLAGYFVGHRGVSSVALPAAAEPAQLSTPLSANGGQPKPSASQAGAQPPAAVNDDATDNGASADEPETATGGQPVVQSALPAQGSGAQFTPAKGQVQPALAQSGTFMVQIAAVSSAEDANVLVGALRKRGYNVSMRHDPADNLMHVQVGPFASHNEAVAMRQKLLNDGYNAIVQP